MNDVLTLVIVPDGDMYAVQCLEKDNCAQGKSIEQALSAWAGTYAGEVHLDNLKNIPPAPANWSEYLPKGNQNE